MNWFDVILHVAAVLWQRSKTKNAIHRNSNSTCCAILVICFTSQLGRPLWDRLASGLPILYFQSKSARIDCVSKRAYECVIVRYSDIQLKSNGLLKSKAVYFAKTCVLLLLRVHFQSNCIDCSARETVYTRKHSMQTYHLFEFSNKNVQSIVNPRHGGYRLS